VHLLDFVKAEKVVMRCKRRSLSCGCAADDWMAVFGRLMEVPARRACRYAWSYLCETAL